jgi:hypothetical protein
VKDGKATVQRSVMFPRLSVDELQALRKGTPPAMQKLTSFSTPNYLILDPSKEQIGDRMDRKVSAEAITTDLATAQKKLGAPAGIALYRDVAKLLPCLEDEDFAKAAKAAIALEKLKGLNDAMKTESDAAGGRLATRVDEKIAEIEAYVDPVAVKEDLGKLALAFKGHALEKKIRERLKR